MFKVCNSQYSRSQLINKDFRLFNRSLTSVQLERGTKLNNVLEQFSFNLVFDLLDVDETIWAGRKGSDQVQDHQYAEEKEEEKKDREWIDGERRIQIFLRFFQGMHGIHGLRTVLLPSNLLAGCLHYLQVMVFWSTVI